LKSEYREILRHYLAALGYRTRKALAGAPPQFGRFTPGGGVRPPVEILSHMSDVLAWALSWYSDPQWKRATAGEWDQEISRFFDVLRQLDQALTDDLTVRKYSDEQMVQGPLADAMTHVGQLCMLRRLAGSPVERENFAEAAVRTGEFELPSAARGA
jgi:hypothetical protein